MRARRGVIRPESAGPARLGRARPRNLRKIALMRRSGPGEPPIRSARVLRVRCSSVIRALIGRSYTSHGYLHARQSADQPQDEAPASRPVCEVPIAAIAAALGALCGGLTVAVPFGAPRQARAPVTPPAPRPCAGRRSRWLRTRRGFSALPNNRWRSSGKCSNNDHRSAFALRQVRKRRVRSRL
jgi:hypothetical protein